MPAKKKTRSFKRRSSTSTQAYGSGSRTQSMRPDPEQEVEKAVSTLTVIAILLGVVVIGIVVFMVASTMMTHKAEKRKEQERLAAQQQQQAVGASGAVSPNARIESIRFLDEGNTVIIRGQRYNLLTTRAFGEKLKALAGEYIALKGTLSNADEFIPPYEKADKTHVAFSIRDSGGRMKLYMGNTTGSAVAKKIEANGRGLFVYCVVKLPKSRYREDLEEPCAEISKIHFHQ